MAAGLLRLPSGSNKYPALPPALSKDENGEVSAAAAKWWWCVEWWWFWRPLACRFDLLPCNKELHEAPPLPTPPHLLFRLPLLCELLLLLLFNSSTNLPARRKREKRLHFNSGQVGVMFYPFSSLNMTKPQTLLVSYLLFITFFKLNIMKEKRKKFRNRKVFWQMVSVNRSWQENMDAMCAFVYELSSSTVIIIISQISKQFLFSFLHSWSTHTPISIL